MRKSPAESVTDHVHLLDIVRLAIYKHRSTSSC